MSTIHSKGSCFFFRIKSRVRLDKVGHRYTSQDVNPPRQIPREKPAVQKKSFLSGLPLLIVPLATFGLGTWQIQRREWKLKLIKEMEEKMQATPVPLPEDLKELKNMEYRKVKVRGTFDHSKELFIGPRSNLHAADTMGGENKAASMGVHVVTPFKLADRDETILVNRGHVKFQNRPPQMRSAGQVEGEVDLIGIVRLSDKNMYMKSNPLKDGFWLSREVEEMADIAGTSEVFIDADINSSVPGGPEGGQTIVSLRNEHLTYVITWYTLSALTLYLWWRNYRNPRISRSMLQTVKQNFRKT
ncbi:surfeit locus protein 1 [Biomphalaria pfeifferi]|uniref:SURF1-like protein n=1 Tax=Biomphalaria pfeifferi TaxID=112525 RepID=A0AAD8C370_BIOPF|nr:surfeit locus protein 1 [Biomphalaria pfeifferi]